MVALFLLFFRSSAFLRIIPAIHSADMPGSGSIVPTCKFTENVSEFLENQLNQLRANLTLEIQDISLKRLKM